MSILGFVFAITSIWQRLIFLAVYMRLDIYFFADFAAKEFAQPNSVKLHKRPKDFGLWVVRIERQLELEKYFPKGCRLGTFAFSPVLQLRDHFELPLRERTSPWSVEDLDRHYRQATGLSAHIDPVMEADAGYSVGSFTKALVALLQTDAALAYLLLCREIQLAAAHHAQKADELFLLKTSLIDHFAHLRGKIVAHAMALAMHEYLWSIVTAVRNAKEIDDKHRATATILNAANLKSADMAKRQNPKVKDRNYDASLDAMAVSVPALWNTAKELNHVRGRGLDEVYATLGLKKGKGGDRTTRPIVHYYGLGWDRLLALGTFEILVVMIGLHKERQTHGVHPTQKKVVWPAARLTRDVVWAMPAFPESDWNEVMRRVHFTMMCYLPPAHNKGGGGRFDPSLLLDPTKDWRAFNNAARRDPVRRRGAARSFTEIVDTIRYRLTLTSRLFEVATKLVVARPNELPHHTERRKRGSQVVALLASSLTMVTSEPLFIPLLKDALKRAGFQQTRGTKGKMLSQDTIASETGPGDSGSLANGGELKSSEATSTQNASETDLGRHWGRKVPTGQPAKLAQSDQPLSEQA